jgi:hypothetical protein
MSMICNLRRVSPSEITQLLEAPEQVTGFLYGAAAAASARSPGLLSRLFGRTSAPAAPVAWAPRRDGDEVDLDKAWHGLHFLFTGTAWEGEEPACYLVQGGREIGDVDVGYGPARALLPEEVGRFAEYLHRLAPEELERRYDPERMTALQIYPEIWGDEADAEDSGIGYLLESFDRLRDFVARARDAGDGIVIYVN